MLSPAVIKSSAQASHYFFEADNYYFKDEATQEGLTQWFGKGAKALGLDGKIDREQFQALLLGALPNGEKLGKMVDGQLKHRPGFDLTFSAPKSVSMLALIAGDKRLDIAHDNAVNAALNAIELACAQARVTDESGNITFENTHNLVVAQFKHDTSRDLDPQRHTHCVVLNMTEREDGKWRALASQLNQKSSEGVNGFMERVFEHKHYFGMIYRSQLAYEIQQLGYGIEKTGEHGLFEIAGITKEEIAHFSKRRQDIEAVLNEKGYDSAKAAAVATLNTRKAKEQGIDREELYQFWKSEANKLGISFEKIIHSKTKEASLTPVSTKLSILNAIEHESTFNVKIRHESLVQSALVFSLGEIKPADILQGVSELVKEGELITLNQKEGLFYTTSALIAKEQHIVETIKTCKSNQKSTELHPADIAKNGLNHEQVKTLTELISQEQSIKLLLGSETKRNTGFVQTLINTYEQNGMTVRVLSPRNENTQYLDDKVQRQPKGIWRWLLNQNKPDLIQTVNQFLYFAEKDIEQPLGKLAFKKQMLLIDSTEKLSVTDLGRLVDLHKQTGLQIIFMADEKSKRSMMAGDSLSLIQMALKKPIELGGNTLKVQKDFHLNIVEHQNELSRYEMMANEYVKLSDPEKKNTVLLTSHPKEANLINKFIHEKLYKNGIEIEILTPVPMTDTAKKFAKSYSKGQVIRFNEDYKKLGIKKGEYASILDIYDRRNVVKLKTGKGEVDWDVGATGSQNETYEKAIKTFAIGEKVTITRKYESFNKNTKAIIENITDKKITLKIENKTISLANNKPLHLDYGYTQTFNQTLLDDKDNLIVNLPGYKGSKQVLHQLSQTGQKINIITDNYDKLTKSLLNNDDKNESAINTVLNHAGIDRFIDNTTFNDLRHDIEKAVSIIQKELGSLDLSTTADKAVEFAMEKLTARNAGFTHKELVNEAISFAFGKTSPDKIKQAIEAKQSTGELILGQKYSDGTRWTTREALEVEKSILKEMKKGVGKSSGLVTSTSFKNIMQNTNLTPSQYAACELIATTKDRFVLIQGYAGTGKSTSLQTLKREIIDTSQSRGESLVIKTLAPSHRAVTELREKGLESQTLQSFIPEYERAISDGKNVDYSNTVFVLDEASMVNNKDWLRFTQIMNESKAKVVAIIGDKAQLSSVAAGKPFELAQHAGFPMAEMTDIIRQQTPELLSAVKSIINRDYDAAFKTIANVDPKDYINRETEFHLTNSIIEVPLDKNKNNDTLRPEKIAEDYLSRTEEVRNNTLIISHTHKGRDAIALAIQEKRIERGELNGSAGREFNVLRPQGLTSSELNYAKHYDNNMVLRFNSSVSSIGIDKNSYWGIKDIDVNNNLLTLYNRDDPSKLTIFEPGRVLKNLKNGIEVYQPQSVKFHEGEIVKFTRRDSEANIESNEIGIVEKIDNNALTLKKGEQIITYRSEKAPLHLDLGYTSTGYGAQGMTAKYVITDEASYLKHLANQRSFYVAISRGQVHASIYTDDKKKLINRIKQNAGDKLSALEVTGNLPRENQTNDESKAKKSYTKPKEIFDAKKIGDALSFNAEHVARQLLGEPNHHLSSRQNLRYGSKGSLSITLAGDKQGLWHNFETGEHGDMLSLIEKTHNVSFTEALRIGSNLTGGQGVSLPKPSIQNQITKDKETSKTHAFAEKLAKESVPLEGTLAEKYLKEQRGVGDIQKGINLRFHPAVESKINNKTMPALLAIGNNANGEVQTVQAIYLGEKGEKAKNINVSKQTFGSPLGADITLTKSEVKAAISFIAEGPETGISIAQAVPNQDVKVTLSISNFKHIDPKKIADTVVLCLDNDGENPQSAKAILEAGKRLTESGKQVFITKPDKAKTDFNDVLKELGKDEVLKKLNQLKPFEEYAKELEKNLNLKAYIDIQNNQRKKDSYTISDKSSTKDFLKMAEYARQKENKTLKEFLLQNSNKNTEKSHAQSITYRQKILTKTDREMG